MVSRRHALTLLGSTAAVGLSGCLFGTGDAGPPPTVSNRRVETTGSIPQYQVAADNAGALPGAAPTDPSVAWRHTPNRYDAAQPVVDGDAVYVAFDGDLVKLALGDGDEAWTVDAGHASQSAPAVHDGVVYLTVWNGGESVPRGLVAVDATDGAERWRALTDNDINTAPTPTDGAVFVGGGVENPEVAAVEHDGTVRWRHDLGEYAAAPAAVDDRVVVADETGTVRRLDATSGEEQWHATVDGRIQQSVAVGDGRAVVAHEGGITALSLAEGGERWRTELHGDPTAPILTDDAVLAGAGRAVIALARADGAERWRVETRERSYTDVVLSGVTGSPVAVGGTVLVATQAGDVYALDDG